MESSNLERVLAEAFPAWSGRVRVCGAVHRGAYSEVFRVETAALPFPLVSKRCLGPDGRPDPDLARRQFDELTRVHEAMAGDPRYRVPRPVRLLEETAIVLMEWVPGETLARELRRPRLPARRAAALVYRTGAWLRRFHASGPLSRAPLDARSLHGRLEELVCAQGPAAGRPFVHRALRALERAIPQIERIPVERSWLHGDFQVDNVVLSRQSVVGLDFSHPRVGPGLHDLAYFLNALENFLLLPKGIRLYPFRRRIVEAFQRGYAAGGAGVDPLALAWLRGNELLRFFLHFKDRGKTRFHDWYFAQAVDLLTRRLATRQSALLPSGG